MQLTPISRFIDRGWTLFKYVENGRSVSLMLLVCLFSPPAAQSAVLPEIVVLKIDGSISFTRQGWIAHQPLTVGSLITPDDFIFPQNATLLVMCPDGMTHEFLPVDLVPNSAVNCPQSNDAYIVGSGTTAHLNLQRGVAQSPTIPYLIAPRTTVIRDAKPALVWNAIPNVLAYSVTVRGGDSTWQSGNLDPATVTHGDTASFTLDEPLSENIAYTVEICVVYNNSSKHCTTDSDWSTGENLAFYYLSAPQVNGVESNLLSSLGKDNSESLYARAVLLSQPFYQTSHDLSLGLYDEAIGLLEQLKANYPNSALASSPETYNFLGDLYQRVNLPLTAAKAYQQALTLASSGTQVAATATLGLAMTTPDSDASIKLYNQTLDNYSKYLDADAFTSQLNQLCKQIGDISFDIDRCQSANAK